MCTMMIRVRLFASLRERLGRADLEWNGADGTTARELWQSLCAAHPVLAAAGTSVSFAVNQEYVEPTHRLCDGDEVAVIPPVSGGAPELPERDGTLCEVVTLPIDVARVSAAVQHRAAGAIVTFVGTTRDHNDGRQVLRLEYEAYPEMAIAEMRKIGAAARQRWSIEAIAIVHRIGVVPVGEASVAIAVSAAHRSAAFAACHFAIDRLKEVVPIWKKEHFDGGEVWIGSQTGQPFPPGSSTP
jgi:MoaE-MoaD fusion protein